MLTLLFATVAFAEPEIAVAPKLVTASRLSLAPKVMVSHDHVVLGGSLGATLMPGGLGSGLLKGGVGASLAVDVVPSGAGFDGAYVGGRVDWAATAPYYGMSAIMPEGQRLTAGVMAGKRWTSGNAVLGVGAGLKVGDHYGWLVTSALGESPSMGALLPMPALEFTIASRVR